MSATNPYQELLKQLQACESQEERDWLSLRFSMGQLPEELQVAIRAAAVPRFFDRAFLNALLDQPLDEEQFAELLEQSSIEPYPGEGRYNVHERSRKLLQERLWQEDEALYREISRRAFQYCKKQDQGDTTWRIETIYHQVIADPDEGLKQCRTTFADWTNSFSRDKAKILLRSILEYRSFIAENIISLNERVTSRERNDFLDRLEHVREQLDRPLSTGKMVGDVIKFATSLLELRQRKERE